MMMVTDSAKELKRFLKFIELSDFARLMVMRLVLTFIMHRGLVFAHLEKRTGPGLCP